MSHDELFENALEMGEAEGEFGQGEFEGEGEFEAFAQEFEGEREGEGEGEFEGESGGHNEYEGEGESNEVALASELLEVTNEQELEQFLGGLFKKIGGVAKGILNTPAGGALKGLLKSAARKALPMLGSAVGGYFGGSTGAKLGGQLAGKAGQIFGLELEGMSHEDREFELARRYVRFANTAIRRMPPRATPAQVRTIYYNIARTLAPGLRYAYANRQQPVRTNGQRRRYRRPGYTGGGGTTYVNNGYPATNGQASYAQPTSYTTQYTPAPPQDDNATSGRWVRRGDRIMLYGV